MRIKVKIRWMPGDVLYTKECYLSNGNSTVHFAKDRGIELPELSLYHFERQRFIFFDELDRRDHFTIRFDHLISLEVLGVEGEEEEENEGGNQPLPGD